MVLEGQSLVSPEVPEETLERELLKKQNELVTLAVRKLKRQLVSNTEHAGPRTPFALKQLSDRVAL